MSDQINTTEIEEHCNNEMFQEKPALRDKSVSSKPESPPLSQDRLARNGSSHQPLLSENDSVQMNSISRKLVQDELVQNLVTNFGPAFATAMANFVWEIARLTEHVVPLSKKDSGKDTCCSENVVDRPEEDCVPPNFKEIPMELQHKLIKEIEKNKKLIAEGKMKPVPFSTALTDDSPLVAFAAANRLRQVALEKNISQKQIAEKLDMSPSFISKVFKNPDRSRVSTLRKIAKALKVNLSDIL